MGLIQPGYSAIADGRQAHQIKATRPEGRAAFPAKILSRCRK
jgi:hypothetical protein